MSRKWQWQWECPWEMFVIPVNCYNSSWPDNGDSTVVQCLIPAAAILLTICYCGTREMMAGGVGAGDGGFCCNGYHNYFTLHCTMSRLTLLWMMVSYDTSHRDIFGYFVCKNYLTLEFQLLNMGWRFWDMAFADTEKLFCLPEKIFSRWDIYECHFLL